MRIDGLIEKAARRRKPLLKITNALRLVNGSADGLAGFTIDMYNRHFVIQKFPHAGPDIDINELTGCVADNFNPDYLVVKYRNIAREGNAANFTAKAVIEKAPSVTIVTENGLNFSVDANDTLNTGLFLDMRRNRKVIAGLSNEKSVLNCFSYTCSFGVYCRHSGASGVVNVDINKKNLERGKENYKLNNISWQKNEFIKSDCGKYIHAAFKRRNFFDIIILDPPTFSRYDNTVFAVKKDFPGLIESAIKALKPGGRLFVSTNYSGIPRLLLESFVKAAGRRAHAAPKNIQGLSRDIDFSGASFNKESYMAALLAEF